MFNDSSVFLKSNSILIIIKRMNAQLQTNTFKNVAMGVDKKDYPNHFGSLISLVYMPIVVLNNEKYDVIGPYRRNMLDKMINSLYYTTSH
jgi:hypothetical protein